MGKVRVGMEVLLKTMILPAVAMLLFAHIAAADTQRDSDSNEEATAERVSSIDFEIFADSIPTGMEINDGATTGESGVANLIERDASVFISGQSSLRISGTDSTTQWYSLSVDFPDDIRYLTARLYVKGQDLQQEGNQFNNCYAGFWYNGIFGEGSNTLTMLPQGTFDWTEVTVSLDLSAQLASDVRFTIFSSISGTLWIDDLTFLYDDECAYMEAIEVQGPLATYIDQLHQPTTFMELAPAVGEECPDSISGREALQDIEMLKYLFENGYSGYPYWMNQGIDFDAVYENLTELAQDSEKISVADMERIIADGLRGIQDGHFSITGHERHRFLDRKCPYFADVIVERVPLEDAGNDSGAEYSVILSNCDSVLPGMIYTGPEDRLFRILSRRGVEQFQLGVFTSEYTTEEAFLFLAEPVPPGEAASDVSVTLPLHVCRLTSVEDHGNQAYYTAVFDGIDLIRVSSFSTRHHENLQEFAESGTVLAEKNMFIIDLMGNGGGSSTYACDFVNNLNGVAQWRIYFAMLCSPATISSLAATPVTEGMPEGLVEYINQMQQSMELLRERPVRNWVSVKDAITPRQMGDYDGLAVFLIDRGVASSGEALLDYSKSIPGAVLIGENSGGVGTFGEVRQYWLPNSRISLSLPCKLFLSPGFDEGVGYIPDYWLDSVEPVSEIAKWLNNPDSYQFELSQAPVLILYDLDFDEFDNGLPRYMRSTIGASCGFDERYSLISQDCEIRTGGRGSLRMEGDIDTNLWYALILDVPLEADTLTVEYSVRGEDIRQEGNQFDNCYVGFTYSDSNGDRQFNRNTYAGSFDWMRDSLQLYMEELDALDFQFIIFLSKSGTFWVDDVVFSD